LTAKHQLLVPVPSEVAKEIGARVRSARVESGLSQADVARALDLSQAAISLLEAGRRSPRVDELALLSSLLARDIDYFLTPMRAGGDAVGMTFRASTAALPLPELQRAVMRFIDEIERQPQPEPETTVRASTPTGAARQARERTRQTSIPVNVAAIARRLGIGLYFTPLPDALSAFLLRAHGHAVIGVNSNQPHVRQRFSAAHEIGHHLLAHADGSVFDYAVPTTSAGEPPGYDPHNEREANIFAAELLMPEQHLRTDARTYSLTRLAKRYEVSEEAMSFRLLNLGLRQPDTSTRH
jgi:Zn-dependent peptidase ImmA (M78 family)/transcriptional regulator with XRE-family HTH domain